jgi:outer membrane protein OmpA-like peptidoglycan-associated protein
MSDHSEQALSHSMTDLMTSLAVIFILLLVVYMNQSYQETQKGSQNIKEKLLEQLNAMKIDARPDPLDPLALVIRLQDEKLQFDFGKAILKPQGQTYLGGFMPNLSGILCSKDNYENVESVLIQGFTDHVGSDENNLLLSQQRAFEVLQYGLNKTGISHQERECLLQLASTNGRGKRDLLPFDEKSKRFASPGFEDSNASRRVEFKIRVKSYELRKAIEKQQ